MYNYFLSILEQIDNNISMDSARARALYMYSGSGIIYIYINNTENLDKIL